MKRLSLGEITNLAEIIGTVAIVVSLIFVGLQIRQNTDQIAVASYQTGLRFIHSINELTATPESADLVIRGLNDFDALSQIDKAQFDSKLADLTNDFFAARQLFLQGSLSAEEFAGFERVMAQMLRSPGAVQWWATTGNVFPQQYQDSLEDVIRRYPEAEPWSEYYEYKREAH
jgi:hypothetical protein